MNLLITNLIYIFSNRKNLIFKKQNVTKYIYFTKKKKKLTIEAKMILRNNFETIVPLEITLQYIRKQLIINCPHALAFTKVKREDGSQRREEKT
jgi:hypothetical protein